jgi:MoxR-like ATPase
MDETLRMKPLEYTGKNQPGSGDSAKLGSRFPYLPSPELVEAVNLAIYLERPLLLKGEPGCGKTQLGTAVAQELNLPLEAWYVKSTSRARDGRYTYDAVKRLRDAQLAASGRLTAEQIQKIDDPENYVQMSYLGRAYENSQRTVVLIDEIDKADIDFPNDLLLELDEQRFFVEETGREVEAKFPPIVFITSNDEKDLPDAFLRRCLFHYVEFPSYDQLIQIIHSRFPSAPALLTQQAVTRFLELREAMRKRKREGGKKPSTSELIDWFQVLQRHANEQPFAQLNGKLPYPGVLLKSWEDHIHYLRLEDRT